MTRQRAGALTLAAQPPTQHATRSRCAWLLEGRRPEAAARAGAPGRSRCLRRGRRRSHHRRADSLVDVRAAGASLAKAAPRYSRTRRDLPPRERRRPRGSRRTPSMALERRLAALSPESSLQVTRAGGGGPVRRAGPFRGALRGARGRGRAKQLSQRVEMPARRRRRGSHTRWTRATSPWSRGPSPPRARSAPARTTRRRSAARRPAPVSGGVPALPRRARGHGAARRPRRLRRLRGVRT